MLTPEVRVSIECHRNNGSCSSVGLGLPGKAVAKKREHLAISVGSSFKVWAEACSTIAL